jgi:hypothetical protein
MNVIFNFLRSLLLASFLSFVAPTLLLGGVLVSLSLLCYIPNLGRFCQLGLGLVFDFLATFGNGQPLEGLLIIGLTCGLVGAIFDAYVFYQHQTWGKN